MGKSNLSYKKKEKRNKNGTKDKVVAGKGPKKAQPEESVENSPSDSFSFHGDTGDEGTSVIATIKT